MKNQDQNFASFESQATPHLPFFTFRSIAKGHKLLGLSMLFLLLSFLSSCTPEPVLPTAISQDTMEARDISLDQIQESFQAGEFQNASTSTHMRDRTLSERVFSIYGTLREFPQCGSDCYSFLDSDVEELYRIDFGSIDAYDLVGKYVNLRVVKVHNPSMSGSTAIPVYVLAVNSAVN